MTLIVFKNNNTDRYRGESLKRHHFRVLQNSLHNFLGTHFTSTRHSENIWSRVLNSSSKVSWLVSLLPACWSCSMSGALLPSAMMPQQTYFRFFKFDRAVSRFWLMMAPCQKKCSYNQGSHRFSKTKFRQFSKNFQEV